MHQSRRFETILVPIEEARFAAYGVLRTAAGQRAEPHLFWESFVGPIPECYQVRSRKLQVCVGKACCNPAHHRVQGPVVETALTSCNAGHPLTPDNVVV